MRENTIIVEPDIQKKIYTIRGLFVMLDRDLAELYMVETRVINQAVKRNIERFDDDFMFQLTKEEYENLKSQNVTSSWGGVRKLPFVFTEQGVYMLATVLKSKNAIETTKQIMRTFTSMKKFLLNHASVFQKFEMIEQKLIVHDKKLNKVFKVIESKDITPVQGIFYSGQIYDAYVFVNNLLKSASRKTTLIDNYIDDTVLTLFAKYPKIQYTIITNPKSLSRHLKLDIDKYNKQYANLTVKTTDKFHDRFLLIDDKEAYHLGASLKDLGKKVFAFSKIDIQLLQPLEVLDER